MKHILKQYILEEIRTAYEIQCIEDLETPIELGPDSLLLTIPLEKLITNAHYIITLYNKIETSFNLPPIPFRRNFDEQHFTITPQQLIDYLNPYIPRMTNKTQISDNVTYIKRNYSHMYINGQGAYLGMYCTRLDEIKRKHMVYSKNY